MRRLAACFTLVLAAAGTTGISAARADCKAEVTAAFDKQRAAKAFRMEADVISIQGPMKLTMDYILPDKLRQVRKLAILPEPQEAILIGVRSWINEGKGWEEAPNEVREVLDKELRSVAEETADQMSDFECMGKQQVDGAELAGYRAQEGPKDLSPDAAKKPKSDTVRIIYLDPASGLPARTIVARPNALDKPLFKAVYSYPAELKIEPPATTPAK